MFSLFAEVISTSPDTIKGSRLQVDIKQLLDEAFVISEIIQVEVSVIPDITKTESYIYIHCFEINNDKYTVT